MRPLSQLDRSDVERLRVFAFDLDDTFFDREASTHRVRLDPDALRSLERLRATGLELAAVTGRGAAFVDVAMRSWPLDHGVAENGAARFTLDAHGGVVSLVDDGDRAAVVAVAERLSRAHGVPLADDNALRRVDVTLDIGEHFTAAPETIAAIVAEARAVGLRTFRSSIHLHLTPDAHDKATGIVEVLRGRGHDPAASRRTVAFAGDSENDRAAFSAFATTFGVANVASQLRGLTVAPRFVAPSPRAVGFVAIADAIVALRTPR